MFEVMGDLINLKVLPNAYLQIEVKSDLGHPNELES
jgi:hypothetical protein